MQLQLRSPRMLPFPSLICSLPLRLKGNATLSFRRHVTTLPRRQFTLRPVPRTPKPPSNPFPEALINKNAVSSRQKANDRRKNSDNAVRQLQTQDFSLYQDTEPPTLQQLRCADEFFAPSDFSPARLWSTNKFSEIPISTAPEIVVLGSSNAGKSTLINELLGEQVCKATKTLGCTRRMAAYGISLDPHSGPKLVLVDTPGYGRASAGEWGENITKYLERRKQLRRALVLISAARGIGQGDKDLLRILRSLSVPHQIVLTKADRILVRAGDSYSQGYSEKRRENLIQLAHACLKEVQPALASRDGPGPLNDVIATSMQMGLADDNLKLRLSPLRWAILLAAGYDDVTMKTLRSKERKQQKVDAAQVNK